MGILIHEKLCNRLKFDETKTYSEQMVVTQGDKKTMY